MIGKVVGSYKITDKIGEGGMGAVYKAVHTKMDRVCAIKLLHPSYKGDESSVARFNREAKMASRIDSPHAVTIYDFGEARGGLLYLAMEYIEGRTLSSVLASASESPLEVRRAVHIGCQVSAALSAAHSFGVVHRDLKPDNIMITSKGSDPDFVKVLDFGIAKTFADSEVDTLTATGFVVGTPMYMSPEQVSGLKVDARSDIYSLALIVYQMLSRKLPFEGDNPQAIMIGRVTSNPIPLRTVVPGTSESIERVVMAGLERDLSKRTRTAMEFASQLTTAVSADTGAYGREHPGTSVTNAATTIASVVPVTRPVVPGGDQSTQQSTGSIENRIAAQSWLYRMLTRKAYVGAIASVLIVVAVSVPIYLSKSGGDASTVSAPVMSGASAEPNQPLPKANQAVPKPDTSKAATDQVAGSAPTSAQKPRVSKAVHATDQNAREDKTVAATSSGKGRKVGRAKQQGPSKKLGGMFGKKKSAY